MTAARLDRLRARFEELEVDALLVTAASNRRWADNLMEKTQFGHRPRFLAEAWNKRRTLRSPQASPGV